jgi:hypothetical protein
MNVQKSRAHLCLLLIALLQLHCDPTTKDPEAQGPHEPSPNATITPSPLVAGGDLVAKSTKSPNPSKPAPKRASTVEVREPPVPLSALQAPGTDTSNPKQSTQLTLAGRLVWPAYPSAHKMPAANGKGTEGVPPTHRRFEVNGRSHGRLQITFHGSSLPFASGTSISSRLENYGHFLVWPDERTHRVLPVGSIRTLFAEGRPDVTPIVHLDPESRPTSEAFDRPTRTWAFETNRGKLALQQAAIEEAGFAGELLCRFLLEWLSVSPNSTACDVGLVPIRAEVDSGRGAKLVWETSELDVEDEPAVPNLVVPPRDSSFREYGLPDPGDVLQAIELTGLRKTGRTGVLTVHNPAPTLQWLLLDGVPASRVPPNGAVTITRISQGTYQAKLVDFFGVEAASQPTLAIDDTATFGAPKPPPASNPEQ